MLYLVLVNVLRFSQQVWGKRKETSDVLQTLKRTKCQQGRTIGCASLANRNKRNTTKRKKKERKG